MSLREKQSWRHVLRSWMGRDVTREDLASLFEVLPRLSTPAERVEWLAQLFHWLRSPVQLGNEAGSPKSGGVQAIRIRFLFQLLERHPLWRKQASEALAALLENSRFLELLADTGLGDKTGLFGEILERLATKVIPDVVEADNLRWVLQAAFPTEEDAQWFETCPPEVREDCLRLVGQGFKDPEKMRGRWHAVLGEALLLLAAKIASLGSSASLRKLSDRDGITDSPFLALQRRITDLVRNPSPDSIGELHRLIADIHAGYLEIAVLRSALETRGVSITIVFQLERLESALSRAEWLAKLFVDGTGADTFLLLAELVRAQAEERGFRGLVSRNFQLFSRKLVERTGASGEHYITRTREEYRSMVLSAMGGGVLTTLTTVVKFALQSVTSVPFLQGFLAAMNYSISFVFIQLCHFTLATKQPSMTAASLAAKIPPVVPGRTDEENSYADFVSEVIALVRSQTAGLFGNLVAAFPSAWAVAWLWPRIFGGDFLDDTTAQYALESLDPFSTLTWFYAAVTGVLLWLSSVAAGAFENWVVYKRLPLAMATHPALRKRFGGGRMEGAAKWLVNNASGLAGNVTLGCLLGFFPVFARFFGLPLDVRHVTLSTCQMALGATAIGWEALDGWLLARTVFGILGIGFLNLSVSFCLATFVALRARRVRPERTRALLLYLRRRFVRRPFFFFLPLGDPNRYRSALSKSR